MHSRRTIERLNEDAVRRAQGRETLPAPIPVGTWPTEAENTEEANPQPTTKEAA